MDIHNSFNGRDYYWICRWKESETIKSNLTEEQRKAIRPEIDKLISIFERPENHNLKFDMRLLKKWIMEYNPKITQNYLEYVSRRVMVNVKTYKLKREDPEKYAEILKQKRDYNKMHPEAIRKYSRKRYLKIKSNPILWEGMRKIQNEYHKRKYKTDPEYRKTLAKYQREYWRRMKEENPEKYHAMQQRGHQICKYTVGVKCPNCGFGIKTATIGHLGKRPIQCPKCRFSYPKNQCEKIRIPRIFPEEQKKTEETKK